MLVAKGDDNQEYDNTKFNCRTSIEWPQKVEPNKIWDVQWPRLLNESCNSRTYNNLVNDILFPGSLPKFQANVEVQSAHILVGYPGYADILIVLIQS